MAPSTLPHAPKYQMANLADEPVSQMKIEELDSGNVLYDVSARYERVKKFQPRLNSVAVVGVPRQDACRPGWPAPFLGVLYLSVLQRPFKITVGMLFLEPLS